jgi:acetyl esterase/lipase
MPRHALPTLLILTLLLGAPGITGAAGTPVASPTGGTAAQPTQPTTGPGGSETVFPSARGTHYGPDPGGYWIWEPTPGDGATTPAGAAPLPVVLYLSGCCGNGTYPTPEEADPWMTHLARQGYVVVAPVYDAGAPTPAGTLPDIQARLREALTELAGPGHARVDPAQLVVLGYSFGGGLAMTFLSTPTEGVPVPRAVFLAAPFCGDCIDVRAAAPGIPEGIKALVLAYRDDAVSGIDQPRAVYRALASLPAADRDFVLMTTDRHGEPPLVADHDTPHANEDAADWYGAWKLADALFACALRGEWCAYALGDTPEQRAMGSWSDGVPITPLRVFDDPGGPYTSLPD